MSTKIVAMSDTHCGHLAGLTPPDYWTSQKYSEGKIQRETWLEYEELCEKNKGCDYLFHLGDTIDGDGKVNGGVEQITTDRIKQAEMAVECIAKMEPKRVIMTYGTAFHTGKAEDFDGLVNKGLNAIGISSEIHGMPFVKVEDVTFHLKHHIGGSGIPYGRHTASSKERFWLKLHEEQGWEKADIILRGHVHYYQIAGGADWLAMTLPALQAANTKFGRRCSGEVHWGLVTFEVDGSEYTIDPQVTVIKNANPVVVR